MTRAELLDYMVRLERTPVEKTASKLEKKVYKDKYIRPVPRASFLRRR